MTTTRRPERPGGISGEGDIPSAVASIRSRRIGPPREFALPSDAFVMAPRGPTDRPGRPDVTPPEAPRAQIQSSPSPADRKGGVVASAGGVDASRRLSQPTRA